MAADGIGRQSGRFISSLFTREFTDPFGAPTVESIVDVNAGQFNVIFSEEILTSSLILSVDQNNDGDVTDLADTQGTVTLRDADGNIIDDVTLAYSTFEDNAGLVHGVLSVIRQDNFTGLSISLDLSSGDDGTPAISEKL